MTTDQRTTLGNLIALIDDFNEECTKREYTDTGKAWDYLYTIRSECQRLISEPTPMTGAMKTVLRLNL
jgi:hypothetical protein